VLSKEDTMFQEDETETREEANDDWV
jgi:hypothetical protein